jgi:hypothetical protein
MNDLVDVLLLSLANLIILTILLLRTDAQLRKIRSIESCLAQLFSKASGQPHETVRSATAEVAASKTSQPARQGQPSKRRR